MFHGKQKAITFSYDDGVTQDRRFIEILNKYNLKATFNLNSELLGLEQVLSFNGKTVSHNKNHASDVKDIYEGHEVATHTLTHPLLPQCSDLEIIRQVEQDRLNLSDLVGYEVVGMAYPCAGINNDARTAEIIRCQTGVKYARAITSTYNFGEQKNLFQFNPTIHSAEGKDKLFELGETFINMRPKNPSVFFVWGHSYEFDLFDTWETIEEFCSLISGYDDIFYGTNKEILL